MFGHRWSRFGSLAFVSSFALSAGAAEPWLGEPFAASPRQIATAAAALEAPSDASIDCLLYEVEVSFDEASRAVYRERLVYRLLDAAAVESWGRIGRDWAPWFQDRPTVRARVVGPGGAESWLDPATLVEAPVQSSDPEVYTDRRSLVAPLPQVQPGVVVEETVERRDREPFFGAGVSGRLFFVLTAPVRSSRITLDAPQGLPLRYATRAMPGLEPRRTLADGRVRLDFEAHDLAAAGTPKEPGMPFHRPRHPHVAYATGAAWGEVAAAYSALVDRQLAGFDAEAILAATAAPKATAIDADRLSALLAFTHGATRYAALALGEAAITPTPPAESLRRGFGDCKDKATLLVGLLRAEGIPAYVALLATGLAEDVEPDLPGLDLFDHAIVYLPGASPVWIDPTDPDSPAGELPAYDQGRWALVASPNTQGLVHTPTSQALANRISEKREVFFADFGSGRIIEAAEYRGAAASQQRAWMRQTPPEERRGGYGQYVESAYLGVLDAVEETGADGFSATLRTRLEVGSARRALVTLEDAALAIPLAPLVERFPIDMVAEEAPARLESLVLPQAFVTEWHYVIHPPPGLAPVLPPPIDRQLGPARYSASFEPPGEDGAIRATVRFDSGPRQVLAGEVKALFDGVRELANAPPLFLTFVDPGRRAMTDGKPHEAVRHYLDHIAAEPSRAVHRLRFAQQLVEVGLRDEAVRQAREAVRSAPELAVAHWVLGTVLQLDAMGRLRGRGFDGPGARAAFERAHELDPDLDLAALDLAIALEHGTAGDRYGPGCDLTRAIELHRGWFAAAPADGSTAWAELLLARDLFRTERFAELASEPGLRSRSPNLDAVKLAALMVTDGLDAVLRQSSSLANTTAAATDLLTKAAHQLLMVRRYDLSSQLLLRVAPRAANPTEIVAYAKKVAKATRWEELPAKSGADAVLMRLSFLGGPGFDTSSIEAVLHPRLRADEPFRRAIEERVTASAANMAGAEMPWNTVVDLGLAASTFHVEGEAPAWRARLETESTALPDWTYLFEEGGQPLLVADSSTLGELGRLALEALDAGRPALARRWLDWAAEERPAKETPSDPVPEDPFTLLAPRAGEEADAEALAGAALALFAPRDDRGATLARLRTASATATDTARRRAFQAATLDALVASGQLDEADGLSREVLAEEPASENAWRRHGQILIRAEAWSRLRGLAEQRLAKSPDDLFATRLMTIAAFGDDRLEEAITVFEQLDAAGRLAPGIDANQWAWALLFRDPVTDQALGIARRAAEATKFSDHATLHTLAAVHAALGQPGEARRVLLQALDARPDGQPILADWWVLGRIAEDLGLPAVARELYERVLAEPDEDEALSTAILARRRLAELPPVEPAKRRR